MSKPLQAKPGFTFGCDPEGFLFRDGKPISAAGIIPGTKHKPHPVDCGAVQVDGVAAEFNINPAASYDEWEHNITTVVTQLRGFLPKDVELRFISSVAFDQDTFDAIPSKDKELGCQPDFDAWTGGVNPPPIPHDPLIRCAGGHLHVGWTKKEDLSDIQHILNCQDLVKQFDFYLGGWSCLKDEDKIRRHLYGKMGACRYKDYGVEYRVLSSFWVDDKALRLEVWNRMNHAVRIMSKVFMPDQKSKKVIDALRTWINTGYNDGKAQHHCTYPIVSLAGMPLN